MADTGLRDSGRFRVNVDKLWNDMYHGNGKPGITTRVQLLEDAVERYEIVVKELNANVAMLTAALNRFQGGAAAVQGGMTVMEKVLTLGIAILAGVIGHIWK